MKHRVSALFFCAVASASLALTACADDEVLPNGKGDGGVDAAPPTDGGKPDATAPVDGAPPEEDAAPPREDGAADSAIDTGPSPTDAGLDALAPDADAAARDAATADASDGSAADAALTCLPSGTIAVVNDGASAYLVNGVVNAPLTLCRGNVYKFAIVASGHPFYIKTVRSSGTGNAYSDGVAPSNGIDVGELTFTVPANAPSSLFYDCSVHFGMSGPITVIAP